MCATYGLTPSGEKIMLPGGLEPISEKTSDNAVAEWMRAQNGTAKITGRIAVNLNPILVGDRFELAWWGLWSNGTGPRSNSFNARDDALTSRWRPYFQQRALIPANWYIEGKPRWQLPGGEPFWIAAVTSTVIDDATQEERLTYAMVTRRGIGRAAAVKSKASKGQESRMPLPLPEDLAQEWLDPERPGGAELVARVQLGSEELAREMHPDRPVDEQPALF